MAVEAGVGFVDILPRSEAFLGSLTKQVNSALTKVGGSTSRMATGVTLGFVALGAAAVTAIGKGISATVELASDVRTLQRVTGQSAESASALLAAGAALGIGIDKLTIGFGLLSKNIVNGAPNLAKYGIVVRTTTGELKPFDDILHAVIVRFNQLPEGPERAAFAMNVFGRSGRTLIPILAKGVDGLKELEDRAKSMGLVMSQDDVDAAKALSIAQNQLGEAFKGASLAMGQSFIPIATKVLDILSTAVSVVSKVPQPVLATALAFTTLTALMAGVVRIGGFFARIWGPITGAVLTNAAAEKTLGVTYVQTTLEIEAQTAAVTSSKFAFASLLPILGFIGIAAGFAAIGMAENAKFAAQNEEAVKALTKAVLDGKTSISALNQEIANSPDVPDWAREGFQEQVDKVAEAVKEVQEQVAAVNAEIASVGKVAQPQLQKLADITGETAGEFRDTFASALDTAQKAAQDAGEQFDIATASETAFADTAKAAMDKAKQAFAEFKASASASLQGFTSDALTALSEKTHLTVDGVVQSFQRAAAATRRFGRDVLEISKTGGDAGKALAQQLLAMGPAAAGLAAFIADASKKSQDKMIEAFGGGASAADKAAAKITKVIVGTLDVVKALLEAIAEKWNITLDLPGADGAKKKVEGIHKELIDTASGRYRAVIEANTVQAIHGLEFVKQQIADIEGVHRATIQISSEFRGGGGHALARGAILGARGFVTNGPTALVGEGHNPTPFGVGREAVLPFDRGGQEVLDKAVTAALERVLGRGGKAGGDSAGIVEQLERAIERGFSRVQVQMGPERVGKVVTGAQERHRDLMGDF